MFDFIVSSPCKDEVKAELKSDDIFYCVYFVTGRVACQVNTYVADTVRGGLIRSDFTPLHQGNFFWGGPYSIFYGSAKE